jgi:hypothetical protein
MLAQSSGRQTTILNLRDLNRSPGTSSPILPAAHITASGEVYVASELHSSLRPSQAVNSTLTEPIIGRRFSTLLVKETVFGYGIMHRHHNHRLFYSV